MAGISRISAAGRIAPNQLRMVVTIACDSCVMLKTGGRRFSTTMEVAAYKSRGWHLGVDLSMDSLMEYTDWERGKWHVFLRQHGAEVLKIGAGPNSGTRFTSVGDLIRHIFSAEKRYIDRLSGRPLTETGAIPSDDIEALFRLSAQSRQDLRQFIAAFPPQRWDTPEEQELGNSVLTVTPRKIIAHILLHEIRHWAQVATFFRMQGLTDGFHDFLFSPAMGGEIRKK